MKLTDLKYDRLTELPNTGGAFIRNMPMKDYQEFLRPVTLLAANNAALQKKIESGNVDKLTKKEKYDLEKMSADFLPAINTFIKGLLCDGDGNEFEDDDIFDVLPQHVALDMFQAAASHIAGKKGN